MLLIGLQLHVVVGRPGAILLSENDIKEELSYAYLHAVASRAGLRLSRPSPDRDSVDVYVQGRGLISERSIMHSPQIGVQLKTIAMDLSPGESFSFDLRMKNYNDMRELRHVPLLLAVYVVPSDPEEWLIHGEDALTSRRCMYWVNLAGAPEVSNSFTTTVRMPRRNIVSPETLRGLLDVVSRGEELDGAV